MRKKYLWLIFVLSCFLVISGCKRDSDELATYKGGAILRGEFYKWIDAKHLMKDTLIKSKKKQEAKLEKMFIEKISVQKGIEQGLDKTEDFQNRMDLTTEGQLIKRLYEMEISEKTKFKEPAVKLRQIMISIKSSAPQMFQQQNPKDKNTQAPQDVEAETAKAVEKAKEVIAKLDKGESFEDLAKKYSDHHSKMKGGDTGYNIRSMLPPEVASVAFSLKEGDYSKEPIKTPRGIYVIMVDEIEELDEDNINDIIENETQAKMIINRMQGSYSRDFLDSLMNAKDVMKDFDKITGKNKNEVIFKIGEKSYTIADIDKRIETRFAGYREKDAAQINDERRKSLAMNYFRYELLKREAIKKGIDKDPEYLKRIEVTKNDILANEYMKKTFEDGVTISAEEIKDEYEKNKDKKYYTMVKKGAKRVKQIDPLNKVKDKIEGSLKRKKGATDR
ncbi:MAG: peptidylprolyl isomerase, partial [Spirochaetes bacterium]|nr:peptidylprolyl isomerase [Spirochaetota bacterium]